MGSTVATNRAQQINELHAEIGGSMRLSVDKAIEIGRLLTEQKAELPHGQWLPWLKANVPFSQQAASNYMRLFNNRKQLKLLNVGSLTEAYTSLLAQPKVQIVAPSTVPASSGKPVPVDVEVTPHVPQNTTVCVETKRVEQDRPEPASESEPEEEPERQALATSWTAPDVGGGEPETSQPAPETKPRPATKPEQRDVETEVKTIEPQVPEWLEQAIEEHEEQSKPFKEVVIEEFERFLQTFPNHKRRLVIETIAEELIVGRFRERWCPPDSVPTA
jgi:hypothetical protein